jgi:hypothetical protein
MIVYGRRASAILYNLLRSRGDKRPYLIPANVCSAVPETFLAAQHPFEVVDIEEPTLEIDRDGCLARLRERPDHYAGIVFVHSYGNEGDPTSFFDEMRSIRSELFVIDDKCLCRPDCDGRTLSTAADVTLFSTGYAKYADLGGGGFAHLRPDVPYDDDHEATVEWLDPGEPEIPWSEHRMRTEAEAEAADRNKNALNAIYTEGLPRERQLPAALQRWRFNIRVPEPDLLVARLFEAGLFASRHYPSLGGQYSAGEFPVASRVRGEIVNLFNDRYFDEERAQLAMQVVLRHLRTVR